MVATAALVIGFITIGLAVVFVAMGGGPKTARDRLLHGQTPAGNKVSGTAITLVVVLVGLVLPGVVLFANADERDSQAPGGVELTEAQVEGRQLFAENCSTCHQLNASNAVGRVGPNLDNLASPSLKELTLNAIQLGRARGMGQMPAQLLDGEDAENVADYVAAVAGR